MSLTFRGNKDSIPIAVVKGGKYDKKILYINPKKEGKKKLKLENDSKFELIPKNEGRFVDYIVGKSGSGKSTLCAQKASYYHLMFPKNNIYLFSRVDDDDAFKNMEKIIKRVLIDESLIDDPIDVLNDFENCLVIFDDVDTYSDNKLMKAIDNIRDQIMQLGRHKNISLMNCSHNVNNTGVGMKTTRTIMNELHNLIFFNKSCNYHQIRYCLKKYFGLTDKQIHDIVKKKNTHLTCISSNHPQYVLTENSINLTN